MRCRKALVVVIFPALFYIMTVVLKDTDTTSNKPSPPMTFKWKSKVVLSGHSRKFRVAFANRTRHKSKVGPRDAESLKLLLFEKLKRELKSPIIPNQTLMPQDLLNAWKINHMVIAEELHHLLKQNIPFDDPRLLKLIKKSTVPPSNWKLKTSHGFHMTLLESAVDRLLRRKEGGFFLEANSFDGEGPSHTLWLERVRGWRGVLLESDPSYFLQLLGKNRRVWAINAALSPSKSPRLVILADGERQLGVMGEEASGGNKSLLPAFPISSIMVALKEKYLDFLSLDLREEEWSELNGIPWEDVHPTVVAIQVMRSPKKAIMLGERLLAIGYLCHPESFNATAEMQIPAHILCVLYGSSNYEYNDEELSSESRNDNY